jgi:ATP-dependent exoDNAse (exonuclease V) beta subunit
MVHTLFAPAYYRERMKGYMDKLNLLYVAFTRARDILYIGIPKKKINGVKSMGDLLQSIMNKRPGKEPCTAPLQDYMEGNVMAIGETPDYPKMPQVEDPWQFRSYPVNRDKRSLRVRLRNDQYFVDEEGIFRTDRMYGNMMHQIFSRIVTEKDLEPVLDAMQKEGQVPKNDREALGTLIRQKLTGPVVKHWFTEESSIKVYNERAILSGHGAMLRPDRVIVKDDLVTVVDFKFGEVEKPSYIKQLSNYMEQLRLMGNMHVEGFIWYVMLDKTVKI